MLRLFGIAVGCGLQVVYTCELRQKLAEMAKKHSSEAFYALDDPLEAAIFSVLVELMKELAEADNEPARIKLIGISKKGRLFDSQF